MKAISRNSGSPATVLLIGGSDSSGGAGIQVDLRMLGAMGVHGVTAITAVTAQNSRRVISMGVVSARQLTHQLIAAVEDVEIGAVKIGMLGSTANIRAVAGFLRERSLRNIVLDPVLVSTSGSALLPASSLKALREQLIPLADVLTPNLSEAAVLLGRRATGAGAAKALCGLGAKSVLLKGGHGRASEVCDYFAESDDVHTFRHKRWPFTARGTGCALASAIAARLARGDSRLAAVTAAEASLQSAWRNATRNGLGARLLLIDVGTN
ncbi:MAG: bifunctional hydroxymethylpyrimidine kinase/phosphomethylpyrimidine kinase [Rudaea sp.]